MARIRRSMSATSDSDAPDFKKMIMTGPLLPPGGSKQKAAGSRPRPGGIGAAGFVCPRLLMTSGQSRWANSGKEVKAVKASARQPAHSVPRTLRLARRRCQALSPRLGGGTRLGCGTRRVRGARIVGGPGRGTRTGAVRGAGLLGGGGSVGALLVEAADDPLSVVVEGQAYRGHQRDEEERVNVLLLPDVRAEVRADPGAGQASYRRDHRE